MTVLRSFGKKVDFVSETAGTFHGVRSGYGYLVEWDDFYAPKLLYALQSRGLITKVASQQFESITSTGNKKFHHPFLLVSGFFVNFPLLFM